MCPSNIPPHARLSKNEFGLLKVWIAIHPFVGMDLRAGIRSVFHDRPYRVGMVRTQNLSLVLDVYLVSNLGSSGQPQAWLPTSTRSAFRALKMGSTQSEILYAAFFESQVQSNLNTGPIAIQLPIPIKAKISEGEVRRASSSHLNTGTTNI
jgi:hypothetical protein